MRDPLSEINFYTAGLMASALAEQVHGSGVQRGMRISKRREAEKRRIRHKRATKNNIAKQSRKRNRKS